MQPDSERSVIGKGTERSTGVGETHLSIVRGGAGNLEGESGSSSFVSNHTARGADRQRHSSQRTAIEIVGSCGDVAYFEVPVSAGGGCNCVRAAFFSERAVSTIDAVTSADNFLKGFQRSAIHGVCTFAAIIDVKGVVLCHGIRRTVP